MDTWDAQTRPSDPALPAEPTEAAEVQDEVLTATGDPRVDAVLASLEPLADTPVAEHVTVFESAIARLRATLDDAGAAARA